MIGQTISHYKILDKLGEGGMGVVYKAEDTKLLREVAIKFLPKHFSRHGDERERFIQEAQAASSLNHPSICVIHEINEVDEETFIVMEYVDGRTLSQWNREQAATGSEDRNTYIRVAVELGVQIAEGLGKAHERGIIHRDVKAENIMVTTDGRAKIMDFGLAKLRGVSKLTKTGSTVGTLAYISPEQVGGLGVDHRADIFSFGVTLYEMLAGRLPFQAAHEAALLYEIINTDPRPLVEDGIDADLNRIVMKCIEKKTEQRYQSMRDVAVDLTAFLGNTGRVSPSTDSTGTAPHRRLSLPTGIAGVLLLLVAGLLLYLVFRSPEENPVSDKIMTRITSAPGLEDEPAFSPDGRFVAYTSDDRGNLDIIVHPLGGGTPIRVVDNDSDDAQPAWSPDGSTIAFVSARDQGGHLSIALDIGEVQDFVVGKHGDIFLVPAFGGTPVKLVDNGYYPSWSPDGASIVFQSPRGGSRDLWIVSAKGGVPRQLTNDKAFDYHPAWSPDGNWIVYASGYGLVFNLRIIPSSGGTPRRLTDEPQRVVRPAWSSDGGFVIYSSDRRGSMNLWKIPFSPSREDKMETPRQVTVGRGLDVDVSVSRAGKALAYSTALVNQDIWEFTVSTGAARQITTETSNEDFPRLSPDGTALLIQSNRGGPTGLWVIDLQGGILQELSSAGAVETNGSWSPDGRHIAYVHGFESSHFYVRALGSITSTKVASAGGGIEYPTWSPDGKTIAYDDRTNESANIWTYNLETHEKKQITRFETAAQHPTWSPDGRTLTFQSHQGSIRHIWTVPSEGGTPRQISFGMEEHSHPQWSPVDPDIILFVLNHKNLCTMSVSTGKIRQLTTYVKSDLVLDHPSWSPDGKKVYYSISRKTGDLYTLEHY